MGSSPDPQRATSHPLAAQPERENVADERQLMADRAILADERERKADERERKADERERKADEREAGLDERQRQLDERERELDKRAERTGAAVSDLQQRVLANIERSRALLARSGKRLDRQEAELRRQANHRERQQAKVSRESAEAERHLVSSLPDPGEAADRAKANRIRARSAIEAFAATQDEIASINEQLAARLPGHRGEYNRTAERAREAARRARDVLPELTD